MISIIQVCKNKEEVFQCNLKKFDGVLEVLRPHGQNPSLLRNNASLTAKGEILLFLDDDSYIEESTVQKYIESFTNENVDILGGPALIRFSCLYTEIVSYLLSSSYVIGPHSNRYQANGTFRESSEKELILCNLAIRKDTFIKHHGFSDELYPWEENDFIKKVNNNGVKSYYDPNLVTTREMTNSVSKLFYKIFTYGHGRGKMAGLDSILYTLPLFIFFLTLYSAVTLKGIEFLSVYLAYLAVIGFMATVKTRKLRSMILAPVLTWVIHFSYGQGLLAGLSLFLIRKCFGHFQNSGNRVDVLK